MLEGYKTLRRLVERFDAHLKARHPQFFGKTATHPVANLKSFKVIHDPIWGTNRFSWMELALIDTPLLQRLRVIHQTGLAHYVYPSARHARFEHSLGVVTIASRIFDALAQRNSRDLQTIVSAVTKQKDYPQAIARLRQELRLAALLHDTGHSLFSHASERVFSKIPLLQEGVEELSSFVGKEKGAGEVLSFCLAQTDAVAGVLRRAEKKILKSDSESDFSGKIDLDNVALMIVGRAKHPFLQFLGDIVSSGFDSDKLDYLLRDAIGAGLPLKYDVERYLYTAQLEKDELTDDENELEKLYKLVGTRVERHDAKPPAARYPYYDTYRLRLPKQAMSTIEQIVICKLMLYSYIYHHQKVRAAEGLLERLLNGLVEHWRKKKKSDEEIIECFLSMDDTALTGSLLLGSKNKKLADYSYRVANRLLPRWVYGLNSAVSHAEGALIKDFFSSLQDKAERDKLIGRLETAIGKELVSLKWGKTAKEALWIAGVWLDVPKAPKFEDMKVLIGRTKVSGGVPIKDIFPIGQWTEAYEAHRFYVRVYAFSEATLHTELAARKAIEKVIGIKSNEFFEHSVNPRVRTGA